jgi:predicted MFS family arabinose efflux permease
VWASTIIYTYIATYLEHVGMRDRTDLVLLVFGVASLLSIWFVGRHIDRQLRRLSLASIVAVGIAAVLFALIQQPAAIWIAAAAWGLGWGGVPTLLQTAGVSAGARHSDAAADAVQSMVVTLWNAAMAGGGILGGMILTFGGVAALPAATALISVPALIIVLAARRHGFARQLSR